MKSNHTDASQSARTARNLAKTNRTRTGKRRSTLETLEGRQLFATVGFVPAAATVGSTKLIGTVIGTAGSYQNKGNTIANAFDANTNTYYDGASANGNWAGLNFGSPEVVTQIQFVPRSGWATRMVGGYFQGSNAPDFSVGNATLFTVTTAPSATAFTAVAVTNPTGFEYVRYVSPNNSYGNVAEIEFDGYNGAPTAVPLATSTPVATVTTTGVALNWTEDPTSIVSSYTVERQGPTDPAMVVIGTTTTTTFSDLTAGASTQYSYAVIANNSLGSSPVSTVITATTPAPVLNPWIDTDIGSPAKTGSVAVSPTGQITQVGGGADIWNNTDQFNFNYQTLTGNGSVVTQVTSQTNSNSWAKSGIMLRESTNADSRYVLIALTPGNGVTFQARTATHVTPTIDICAPAKAGVFLQLTRSGSTITGSYSVDGINWTVLGSVNIAMVNNVLAGVAVTAHNNGAASTAVFSGTAVNAYDTTASYWSDAATAPMARWEAENFSYNGKLYVFGGFDDRNLDATSLCEVYDPVANTWTALGSIPVGALTHAAVTMVGDTAYFAGGDIGTFNREINPTSTSEVITYDTTTGLWGSVASLPAAVSCGGMVCINNQLIYYGGLNATDTADASGTYMLDLSNPNATWVAEAAMLDARNHLGAVEINGIAYAVGGGHLYNETGGNDSTVDAYNPVTNTWTKVASLPMPMSSNETTTIVANGSIVVIGGQTNGGYDGIYLNAVQEYNVAANSWTNAASLPEANEGEAVAYIDNELVVVGGTVDNLGGWAQNQTWCDAAITF